MALTKRTLYKTNTDMSALESENSHMVLDEWTSDPEIAVERLKRKGINAHVSDAEVVIELPFTEYQQKGAQLIREFEKTLYSVGYGCAYGINFTMDKSKEK